MNCCDKMKFDPDMPANPKLGKLFDELCATDHGKALLNMDLNLAYLAEDPVAGVYKVIKNRMRRAFEAGYDACDYATADPFVKCEIQEIING